MNKPKGLRFDCCSSINFAVFVANIFSMFHKNVFGKFDYLCTDEHIMLF